MKWYKHHTDNYRGRSIEELHFQMGHIGISCYYLITEICAEKLEKIPNKTLETSDCSFKFSQAFVRRNLRISSTKLEVFLNICSGLGLFSFEFIEKDLHINYPILLELLDSDSKKSRSRREDDAAKQRLDIDKNRIEKNRLDKDLQKEKTAVAKGPASDKSDALKLKANYLIKKYCELFKLKYSSSPEISGKDAGIAKRIASELSEEKVNLYLEAFFSMPDAWLMKAKHPLHLFETKKNEIVVFANSGKFTSQQNANSLDKSVDFQEKLKAIRSGVA